MKVHLPREVVDIIQRICEKNNVDENKILKFFAKRFFDKFEKSKNGEEKSLKREYVSNTDSNLNYKNELKSDFESNVELDFNKNNLSFFTDRSAEPNTRTSTSNVPLSSFPFPNMNVFLLRTMMDYDVISPLGSGGFATVYKIRNKITGKLFAVYTFIFIIFYINFFTYLFI
jgi:hypothetical protein